MVERRQKKWFRNGTKFGSLSSQIVYGGMLKTPSAFEATVASQRKNQVSGNSGSLVQEIMGGYVEQRGLYPTPMAMDAGGRGAVKDAKFENGTFFRENAKGVRFGVQLTDIIASKLLPTVQTQGLKVCKDVKTAFMALDLLPTPNASEGEKYTKTYNPKRQDSRHAMNDRGKSNLGEEIAEWSKSQTGTASQLNPLFVAEMMGFPPDWTVLPFLTGESNPSKLSAMP